MFRLTVGPVAVNLEPHSRSRHVAPTADSGSALLLGAAVPQAQGRD